MITRSPAYVPARREDGELVMELLCDRRNEVESLLDYRGRLAERNALYRAQMAERTADLRVRLARLNAEIARRMPQQAVPD